MRDVSKSFGCDLAPYWYAGSGSRRRSKNAGEARIDKDWIAKRWCAWRRCEWGKLKRPSALISWQHLDTQKARGKTSWSNVFMYLWVYTGNLNTWYPESITRALRLCSIDYVTPWATGQCRWSWGGLVSMGYESKFRSTKRLISDRHSLSLLLQTVSSLLWYCPRSLMSVVLSTQFFSTQATHFLRTWGRRDHCGARVVTFFYKMGLLACS